MSFPENGEASARAGNGDAPDGAVISGEFHTNGKTFVFRLAGTSLSGVGDSPGAAFQDLVRAEAAAGDLAGQLKDLAREQRGEAVRAGLVRNLTVALVGLALIGGMLAGAAALAPKVAADLSDTAISKLRAMSPEARRTIYELLHGTGAAAACPEPAEPNARP